MNTIEALAMREANKEKENKVFDWHKAARLIKERKAKNASAGLGMDWEWTGGEILIDGEPCERNTTYLSSCWAIPELDIDGEIIECYKMISETDDWHSDTFWPESALKILKGK